MIDRRRVKNQINWWKYRYFQQNKERLLLWFVWKLPDPVIYWAAIRAAVEVEKNGYPGEVTVEQLLKKWGNREQSRG